MRALNSDIKLQIFRTLVIVLLGVSIQQASGQVTEVQRSCTDVQVTPAKYRVQKTDSGPTLYVSVSPEVFERADSILNLACFIHKQLLRSDAVDVYIFDDSRSARNIALGFTDQEHYGTHLSHLVAHYVVRRERSLEFLDYVIPTLQDGLPVLIRTRLKISP